MAKTRQQKEAILSRVREGVKGAASTIFVHFTGVKVSEEQKLRAQLKQEGISYFVAKKSLIGKALEDAGIEGSLPTLPGEVAIAYNTEGGDPTAPARSIHAIGQALTSERFSILGGVYEKRFLDQSQMMEIATIPPIAVLRGMFVNVINSPIQGLVLALNAIADKKTA